MRQVDRPQRDHGRRAARRRGWSWWPGGCPTTVGRKPVYTLGALFGLVFAFPAAWLVQTGTTLGIVAAFVGGLGLVYGWVYGPLAAFWSELFDTRYRYSALGP